MSLLSTNCIANILNLDIHRLDIAMLESMKARWHKSQTVIMVNSNPLEIIISLDVNVIKESKWYDHHDQLGETLSDNNDMISGSTPWGHELYRDLI